MELHLGGTYYMPGDKKIEKLVYQGMSPMDPNLMIFMIISTTNKGGKVSNLEFIGLNSSVAQRLWNNPKPPEGHILPPELREWNAKSTIDMRNCQILLSLVLSGPEKKKKMNASISFSGRFKEVDERLGYLRVTIRDGKIQEVELP